MKKQPFHRKAKKDDVLSAVFASFICGEKKMIVHIQLLIKKHFFVAYFIPQFHLYSKLSFFYGQNTEKKQPSLRRRKECTKSLIKLVFARRIFFRLFFYFKCNIIYIYITKCKCTRCFFIPPFSYHYFKSEWFVY